MELPCRYELVLGLTIDGRKEKSAQVQKIVDCNNLISAFVRCHVTRRWMSLSARGSNDGFGDNELAEPMILERADHLAWKKSDGVAFDMICTVLFSQHAQRASFSQLRSKFSSLANDVTKTE